MRNSAVNAPAVPAACIERVQTLLANGGRRMLGIVGPPGSGKSTLADALCNALPPGQAIVVPMDGFHLANSELERLHRRQRKGAPDTFDAAGYAALLKRLRERSDEVVYAPAFRREHEEPIAGAIAVPADTPLIITEGNYLLLDHGPWHAVSGLLDEVWYVNAPDTVRRERLAARHRRFGRSAAEALAWVQQSDEPNARLIEATRVRAHWEVAWT
jgi:pantothenate kinase